MEPIAVSDWGYRPYHTLGSARILIMVTISDDPEIVCLCGSTRFKERFRSENERLTRAGKIVLTVGVFGHDDDVKLSNEEKEMLDELHKRKIDLADRVHILNVDGYVGDSTESEIEYARDTGTEVTFLVPSNR